MKIESSKLQKIDTNTSLTKGVELYVKRDDMMHKEVSGNKWRKLSRTLNKLREDRNVSGLLTFGGAYSNHLLAVAFVARELSMPSVGIIRGEEVLPLNSTLSRCAELGMTFEYWSRESYRNKGSYESLNDLKLRYPAFHISPEGGADELGVEGCIDIVNEVNSEIEFDYISIDCGTGATLAGMVRGLKVRQKAIGIQVLKGRDFISEQVERWNDQIETGGKYVVFTDYHFGGYAKNSLELIEFMRGFKVETGIEIDPIYTSKQFYGILDLIEKDYFPQGSKIVLVHSGGMQGLAGFEERYGVKVY